MKPLVPGASQLLRARPATRKRRIKDKGYRIEGQEKGKSGGEREKRSGRQRGWEREGEEWGKGRERRAIRDTEGAVETWRDLNNTLHLNASTDKRNGPATRNILLRAIIFSLANATVVIVSLSRISCNPLSARWERRYYLFQMIFSKRTFFPPSFFFFLSLPLSLVVGILFGDKRRFSVRGRIYERTDAVVAFFRILVAREYIGNGIKMEMFPAGTSPYSSRISTTSP